MAKVIVIAPHPDDETLGCGGTILKHKKNGDKIYWLIMTNIFKKFGWAQDKVKQRQQEIDKVADLYGFDNVFKLDFPTIKLDQIPFSDIVNEVSEVFKQVQPEIIYVNNRSDIHTDHHISFQAIISCTKNFRYPFIKKILMYETLSETEFAPAVPEACFIPNVFIDISDYIEKKTEIMRIYASEVMESPLPRSLEAIIANASIRGSRISKKYAEAFQLLLEIS